MSRSSSTELLRWEEREIASDVAGSMDSTRPSLSYRRDESPASDFSVTGIVATLRHTRYQAAVIRDGCLLLVQCAFRDGSTWWMLPGGGREEGEDETTCVAREVMEECGVVVHVDQLLSDVPAQPPDGTYVRWRTYRCTIISGEPKAGGGEGPNAELVATRWLPLSSARWSDDIASDQFLYPQLLALQAALDRPGRLE